MAETERSKAPLWTQLRSFSAVFWISNWMELVERFAYYGVRVVLPVYMVLAVSEGGPELTHVQKGSIYGLWAVVQSFLPIFTGGFADRYGCRINIAVATVLKIIGYLVMGYCIPLTEMLDGMSLADARDAGVDHVYEVFFAGAMFLAAGTAIFKPGLQGLIAKELPKESAAFGWGVFYQCVNIGGFFGPLAAGYLRVLDWDYVFLICAAGIALNFIPLFFFSDPEKSETKGVLSLLKDAVYGLLEPRLFFFTMAFAGFWLMFYQLFDILPNFIEDWVDSRMIADALGDWVPRNDDGNMTQEWMINVNALLISFLAFAFGYLTGFFRSLTAIVVGIGVSAIAIYGLGMSMNGWWIVGCIALFSIGEMAASPTKMRYLASIAPKGKEGLYMGYVNMTVGIGWSVGSVVAGHLYEEGGDKVGLAQKYLVEHEGLAEATVSGLDRANVVEFATNHLGIDAWQLRELLWEAYDPSSMWLIFTAIGVGSLQFLLIYDRVVRSADANPQHSFNTKGHLWVRIALIPILLGFGYAIYLQYSLSLAVLMALFSMLFIASMVPDAGDSGDPGEGGPDDEKPVEPSADAEPATF